MDPQLPLRDLTYTIIYARDMEGMRKFYGSLLNFPVNRELGPQWIEYRVGANLLALTERGLLFDDAAPPRGALSVQLGFRVALKEVDACAKVLAERGVKIVGAPTDQPWGHRTLFFRDPDGNVLEIYAELSAKELDKETYRAIIQDYFMAFGTRDFKGVQFSKDIKFLSPISGNTMDGPEAVRKFVSGVSTRVSSVNVVSIAVDYPTASGVWQMTTTKGVQYTLHNSFRLDGEGLAYIWPMFDPKAPMNDPAGLLQWLTGVGYFPVAARSLKQIAGVTISKKDRLFINSPRWIDEPTPSVAEVAADGSLIPYPNEAINFWDKKPGESAGAHFVCVQSVYVDQDDVLWILDPASPGFQGVVPGGAKLLRVSLATNEIERVYHFDDVGAPPKSYLNDVRIAHGCAFMSDSGLGAIVVLNLSTGKVRRLLEEHPSTKAEPDCEPVIGGRPWKFAGNVTPQVHSDGIAIDPKREYVYYKALTGRTLYRVPIKALLAESMSAEALGKLVERVAVVEATDGLEFDAQGNLYLTALESNAIKVLRPDGRIEMVATANDFLWPDTITLSHDGDLLFTAAQFHLMPASNGNIDKRTPPYKVFRLKLRQFIQGP